MSFFIPAVQAAETSAGPSGLMGLLPFVAIFAIFYFLVIRPQRKRQKEHTNLVAALSKGDEVVTTSGMLGKVVKVDENYTVIEVAENVQLRFQKASVHAVLPKGTIKAI
jgi:preprotein translocase subunit YajC